MRSSEGRAARAIARASSRASPKATTMSSGVSEPCPGPAPVDHRQRGGWRSTPERAAVRIKTSLSIDWLLWQRSDSNARATDSKSQKSRQLGGTRSRPPRVFSVRKKRRVLSLNNRQRCPRQFSQQAAIVASADNQQDAGHQKAVDVCQRQIRPSQMFDRLLIAVARRRTIASQAGGPDRVRSRRDVVSLRLLAVVGGLA